MLNLSLQISLAASHIMAGSAWQYAGIWHAMPKLVKRSDVPRTTNAPGTVSAIALDLGQKQHPLRMKHSRRARTAGQTHADAVSLCHTPSTFERER